MRQDEQAAVRWLHALDQSLTAVNAQGVPRDVQQVVHATYETLAADRYSGFMFRTELSRCLRRVSDTIGYDDQVLDPTSARLWRFHPLLQGERWTFTDPNASFMQQVMPETKRRHLWSRRKYS